MKAILGALALVATTATAADLSVFGFTLGEPLRLPECHYRLSGSMKLYDTIPAQTCAWEAMKVNGYAEPQRRIIFSEREAPAIVANWQAIALERNGRLLGIEFYTGGAKAQDLVLAQLTAKYGPPASAAASAVQNMAGATFDNVDAVWHGPVEVTFWGTFRRLDSGRVTIDLPEAAALRRTWFDGERSVERRL